MNGSLLKRQVAGFTLLEILVVLAVASILLSIGGWLFSRQIRDARSMDFVEALAQDINLARSVAMAKGQRTQVEFVSANQYVVKNLDAAGQPVLASQKNTSVTISGVNVGDKLICSSGGFCLGYTAAGAMKTLNQVSCTFNGKTRVLSITVLGLTRIES
ncbi:pilus assembly FimT family protein [Deinococcus metallilatus]|nr:GspH/FimT family pseudopilin [Deinococcus metallilatus]MBB5293412.1 prepilin-type N-terminal cleavage/methylation domain-containing protein [Deinococcus metallilatus]GMA15367.1 hypothetical protein GCM10025871_16980 [Deinococcus metallilatus]